MGRYAQSRRRGSHNGTTFLLPAPTPGDWNASSPDPGIVLVLLSGGLIPGADAFLWEWRQTLPVVVGPFGGGPASADTVLIEDDAESDALQYIRIRWCDLAGTPLSDWSGEIELTVD